MKRICLITEELPALKHSGGIGTAFHELALGLADAGHGIDLIYVGPLDRSLFENARNDYEGRGVRLLRPDLTRQVWSVDNPEKLSYAIYRHLSGTDYDFIHFAEYRGLAFFTLQAKRLCGEFSETNIVIQTHGPTRWAMEANQSGLQARDHLLQDFMERRVVEGADSLVSPSRYLTNWMAEAGFVFDEARLSIIQNLCALDPAEKPEGRIIPREIVFFGRHEARKGLGTFVKAIDRLSDRLAKSGVRVTFLGKPSTIGGAPSEVFITQRARRWEFPVRILDDLDRDAATKYLAQRHDVLVVVPSAAENLPYTVLESLCLGHATLTTAAGGAKELFAEDIREECLFDGTVGGLSDRLASALSTGLPCGRTARTSESVREDWLEFHSSEQPDVITPIPSATPKVVVGIVHHDRPAKLVQAVNSAVRQTYGNIQIVIVDDGSNSDVSKTTLVALESALAPQGGRIIRQENRYLGAARNLVARETTSDFLFFLDDDDLLLPDAIEKLVDASLRCPNAIIGVQNLHMPESERLSGIVRPEDFKQKAVTCFTGGPLASLVYGNQFSGSACLIPRGVFEDVGGYSEIFGVGYEDFEFLIRAAQLDVRIEVYPIPLYLYEVDRPSMISETPPTANVLRILNAIDFSKNGREWIDLISTMASPRSLEQSTGRSLWLENVSDHVASLKSIRDAPVASERRRAALIEYSLAIGARQMALAWAEWRPFPEDRSRPDRRDESVKASLALLSASLGNAEDAVAMLEHREIDISESMENSYNLLLDDEKVRRAISPDAARDIIVRLKERKSERSEVRLKNLSTIFKIANDFQFVEEANAASSQILRLEEELYLAKYPDVDEAVRQGKLRCALTHYADHGRAENRVGFDTAKRLDLIPRSRRLRSWLRIAKSELQSAGHMRK